MARLVILIILTGCILSIVAMSTNWLSSSLVSQVKPKDLDWPPTAFVTAENSSEKNQSKTRRTDLPDWLLALADLTASGSRRLQESSATQPEVILSKPEPVCQTIHVPIFENLNSRRGPEIDLTRMVIREIEVRTPFKIVSAQDKADSELRGKLLYQAITGGKLAKSGPVLEILMLEFEWRDLRQGKILAKSRLPVHDLRVRKYGISIIPDERALEEMARKVVDVLLRKSGE
jgi:hypothetical protein